MKKYNPPGFFANQVDFLCFYQIIILSMYQQMF